MTRLLHVVLMCSKRPAILEHRKLRLLFSILRISITKLFMPITLHPRVDIANNTRPVRAKQNRTHPTALWTDEFVALGAFEECWLVLSHGYQLIDLVQYRLSLVPGVAIRR